MDPTAASRSCWPVINCLKRDDSFPQKDIVRGDIVRSDDNFGRSSQRPPIIADTAPSTRPSPTGVQVVFMFLLSYIFNGI